MVARIGSVPSWKRLRSEGWTRAAGAQYTSGIYFVAMIDGNGGSSLGFAHENWKFTQGQAFPPTLTFDGQQPFNIHGVTVADKVVRVLMPTNSALIAQFRKATACGAVPAAAGYRDQVVDRAWPRAERPDSLCRHDDPAARKLPAITAATAYLVRACAAWAFQLLQLTLARLRWSVASGRRVCRSYAAMMC